MSEENIQRLISGSGEGRSQLTGKGQADPRVHHDRNRSRYRAYDSAPYLRSRLTTGDLMYLVVLALLPCAGVGIYHYGFHAAILLGISVLSAILAEFVCSLVKRGTAGRRQEAEEGSPGRPGVGKRGKRRSVNSSVMDYSCVVTGLIGGLILPPAAPYWFAVLLPVLAIVVFKYLFGGLGRNLFNPAMAAKCVLLLVFRTVSLDVTTWEYTDPSPLVMLSNGETPDLLSELTGNTAGYIGTSSAAAVLAAVVILYLADMIRLDIPLSALISFALCYVLIGRYGLSAYTLGIQICGGSLLFTVFIMAQDFTTSPVSTKARILYGIILGVLIFMFRQFGFLEDACVYALLIANVLRPVLDHVLPQPYFGVNSTKWVIQETGGRRKAGVKREEEEEGRTNAQMDAEFAAFEAQIEKETQGLETARYTGDDTMLREAMEEMKKNERNHVPQYKK